MEQNINTNENITMQKEEQVQNAIDSIAVIKQMLTRSTVNMHRLGVLFLIYGAVTLASSFLTTLMMTVLTASGNISIVKIASMCSSGFSIAVTIALFVVFMQNRKKMTRTENSYTMKLYDMWGIVLFGSFVLSAIISFAAAGMSQSGIMAGAVLNIMKYTAVCLCIFFTGHQIENKILKAVSIVMLCVLPMLFAFDISAVAGSAEITSILDAYSYLASRAGLANILTLVVYIVMGIFFIIKNRNNSYGD